MKAIQYPSRTVGGNETSLASSSICGMILSSSCAPLESKTSARPWAAPDLSTADDTEMSSDFNQGKSSEVTGLSAGVIETILPMALAAVARTSGTGSTRVTRNPGIMLPK